MNAMTQRDPKADEVIDVTVVDVDHLPKTEPVDAPAPRRDIAVGSASTANLVMIALAVAVAVLIGLFIVW